MLKSHVVSALTRAVLVSTWIAGSLLASGAESSPSASEYSPYVAPASNDGQLAIKKFEVAPGLKVDLWAAEPLLANPVCLTPDAQGRWYVGETFRHSDGVMDIRGVMDWLDEELANQSVEDRIAVMREHLGQRAEKMTRESERVRLIEDTDGDGKGDKATVFAQGFNHLEDGIGAGLLAHHGNVYYTCIPDLWLLRDTNHDGVADIKKSLQYGYGVRVGFLGHDLHGLRMGPDGRVYFTIGDRGFNVRTPEGRVKETEMGAVLRCNPDGSGLEIFARGLRNPQELAFDDHGNLFAGDNNSDGGDPARWVYVVEGGDSGWRVGYQFINYPNSRGAWNAERLCYPPFEGQAAYLVPPVALIANGPSGTSYYPGTGLPNRFQGHFLLCDFRGGPGSGVHSFALKAHGAGFEMIDRDHFIWDILATDVEFGMDGGAYVTDWVQGWSKTGKGRIYRIHDPNVDHDPLVLETKKLLGEGMSHRPKAELSELLGYPDMRVRQEAQFALAGQDEVAALREVAVKSDHPLARLHAVWGLGQIARQPSAPTHQQSAFEALIPLLGNPDPEVRAQAAKVLGDAPTPAALNGLIKLLADPNPRPRFFAAIALGNLGHKEAVQPLLTMLRENNDADPYLRHAGVTGLERIHDKTAIENAAADGSASVRMAALLVWRRWREPSVARFLHDSDPLLVAEAARAIIGASIQEAMPELASLAGDLDRYVHFEAGSREKPGPRDALLRRIVNANFRVGTPQAAARLARIAGHNSVPDSVRDEALEDLGEWSRPSGRDHITGLWRPLSPRDARVAADALHPVLDHLLRSAPERVQHRAVELTGELGLREAAPILFELVKDHQAAAPVRVAALKSLGALQGPLLEEAVKTAAASDHENLRNEATRLQSKLQPSDATARLRSVLENGTTGEKQAALQGLADLHNDQADQLLAHWLDKLMEGKVPLAVQLDLLEAAAKHAVPAIQRKLAIYSSSLPKGDDLAGFREALEGGNAEAGRKVFFERPEASCMRCHKIHGEGGEAGPDLSGVGRRKPRSYLLESILYPNKEIAPGFASLLVTLKNGSEYAGIVKSENEKELVLNSPEEGPVTIDKSQIDSRITGLSAMPQGFAQILSKEDLRNLVEFLASLKK